MLNCIRMCLSLVGLPPPCTDHSVLQTGGSYPPPNPTWVFLGFVPSAYTLSSIHSRCLQNAYGINQNPEMGLSGVASPVPAAFLQGKAFLSSVVIH